MFWMTVWLGCGEGMEQTITTTDPTEDPVDGDDDGATADVDCDDADATRAPGLDELCDGVDNDCDGLVDDADEDSPPVDRSTWYADVDGDGFGDPTTGVAACEAPAEHVLDDQDCDDTTAAASPSQVEVCDGIDNDCDTVIDTNVVPRDFATIQAALDARGSPRQVDVCLAPGTYRDAVAIPASYNAITLHIESAGTLDDTAFDLAGRTASMFTGRGNLEIEDVAVRRANNALGTPIDGVFVNLEGGDLVLDGLRFDSPTVSTAEGTDVTGGIVNLGSGSLNLDDIEVTGLQATLGSMGELNGGFLAAKSVEGEIDGLTFTNASITSAVGANRCVVSGGLLRLSNLRDFGPGTQIRDLSITDASVDLDCAEQVFVLGGLVHVDDADDDFGIGGFDAVDWVIDDNTMTIDSDDVNAYGLVRLDGEFFGMKRASLSRNAIEAQSGTFAVSTGILLVGEEGSLDIEGLTAWSNRVEVTSPDQWDLYGSALTGQSALSLRMRLVDFRDNRASAFDVYGGAVGTFADEVEIENAIFAGNVIEAVDDGFGGALYVDGTPFFPSGVPTLEIDQADFVGNRILSGDASLGGAINDGAATELRHVNLVNNEVVGKNARGAALNTGSATVLEYCNAFGNLGAEPFDDGLDPSVQPGNLAVDPRYADITSADPTAWDLTLQAGSPLIDASALSGDPDGSNRDIGAYGGPLSDGW